jgi:hypothetical protein
MRNLISNTYGVHLIDGPVGGYEPLGNGRRSREPYSRVCPSRRGRSPRHCGASKQLNEKGLEHLTEKRNLIRPSSISGNPGYATRLSGGAGQRG